MSLTDRLAGYPEKPLPYNINKFFRRLSGIRIKDTAWAGFYKKAGGTRHQHPDRGVTLAAMHPKSERHTDVEID